MTCVAGDREPEEHDERARCGVFLRGAHREEPPQGLQEAERGGSVPLHRQVRPLCLYSNK